MHCLTKKKTPISAPPIPNNNDSLHYNCSPQPLLILLQRPSAIKGNVPPRWTSIDGPLYSHTHIHCNMFLASKFEISVISLVHHPRSFLTCQWETHEVHWHYSHFAGPLVCIQRRGKDLVVSRNHSYAPIPMVHISSSSLSKNLYSSSSQAPISKV